MSQAHWDSLHLKCFCCSPEIVQSKPYGEKADIWAIGCILYQMCTLEAPFYSTNMLCLATKVGISSCVIFPSKLMFVYI